MYNYIKFDHLTPFMLHPEFNIVLVSDIYKKQIKTDSETCIRICCKEKNIPIGRVKEFAANNG